MNLQACLLIAGALFSVGLYGLLVQRSAVGMLLSIELMANAANIVMVAFSQTMAHPVGQVFALFALAITVAEVVVGLALVIVLQRTHGEADAERAARLRH